MRTDRAVGQGAALSKAPFSEMPSGAFIGWPKSCRYALAGIASMGNSPTAGGHIDRWQFVTIRTVRGWTIRSRLAFRPTVGGGRDLCSSAITWTTAWSWPSKPRSYYTPATQGRRVMCLKAKTVRDTGQCDRVQYEHWQVIHYPNK